MLVSAIQYKKGSSNVFIDLLAFQDLQLLKAKRGNEENSQSKIDNELYLFV